jgi:nucleoside-diphosphate-sugar epimerase
MPKTGVKRRETLYSVPATLCDRRPTLPRRGKASMLSEPTPPQSIEQLDEVLSRPTDAVVSAIAECPGRFVVLGAGGKMGFHVSRMLQRSLQQLGRSDDLTVVSRFSSPDSRRLFEQHRLDLIAADLSDPDQLATVPLAENVIYLAGIKFGSATDPDLLQQMNVTMPGLVANRFRDSRIVALSTGCVYSFTTPASGGSTEASATDPPGDYAISCLERERAFTGGSRQYGTRCALVRLNYSIDLRYGVLVDIAQQVRAGAPIAVDTSHVNVIWQGDAVAQVLQCLLHASANPFIINITGSETLGIRDIAERFGRRFDRVPSFTGNETPTCWLSNNGLARKLFGDPSMSVDDMIEWIAAWLERGGETLGKPTQFQNRDGNY